MTQHPNRPTYAHKAAGTLPLLLALLVLAGACVPLPAESPRDSGENATPRKPPCAEISFPPDRLACLKKEFSRADGELNAVYKKLRASLSEPVRGDLKDNSLGWIRMKEYNCEFQSEMMQNATTDARQAAFYRCALDYTTDRIQYLRRAFGREGVKPGLPGEYDDGFSGSLAFEPGDKQDSYKFRIEVVRGPTAHIGEIDGEVFLQNGATGVFKERPNCPDSETAARQRFDGGRRAEPCCRLDFRLKNHKGFRTIAVKETNCGYYHGARAYFDGLYRKIK
ncbi:MAG: DUF1311 domain-containing protein [bacterium]|nr:DUF1311 domain-containing protein [bacterium]